MALLAGLCVVAPAAAQVSVSELEVHLRLTGDTRALAHELPVKNDGQGAQQVRVVVGDWVRDSAGNNVFSLPADGVSARCGERLKVSPASLEVAPGTTARVRVRYEPSERDEGCWAVVFVESGQPAPLRADGRPAGPPMQVRYGVKVYVHRTDAQVAARVDTADVRYVWRYERTARSRADSTRVREATVIFANTGTAHLKASATHRIRDSRGQLVHEIAGIDLHMVPGSTRYVGLAIPALPSGVYVSEVGLDYGGRGGPLVARTEFRVP